MGTHSFIQTSQPAGEGIGPRGGDTGGSSVRDPGGGIPPRPPGGFGEPGLYSGDVARRSPVTPELVQARYSPVSRINPSFQVGRAGAGNWPVGGDDQADDGKGWTQFGYVDRPSLLIPTDPVVGVVLFNPILPAARDESAIQAFGSGVIFAWAPGVYWAKVDRNNTKIGYIQVPLDDPAMASLLASTPGAMSVSPTNTDGGASRVSFAAKGVTATLLEANARRRAAVITVENIADPLTLLIKFTPANSGPAGANDSHMTVNEGSVITLTGDMNYKGFVRAIIPNASVAAAVDVHVLEFL